MTTPNNPPNTPPVLTPSPPRAGFNIEHATRFVGSYVRAFLVMGGWIFIATVGGSSLYVAIRIVFWALHRIQTAVGF